MKLLILLFINLITVSNASLILTNKFFPLKFKVINYSLTMDETNYIYHTDHLGSITYITDENGNIVESYEYKTYGEPTIKDKNGNILENSLINNPFLFTGREYDTETGLYFYRSRYYDPEIGRFIQEDPISFQSGDLNLYTYVQNNPVNYKDPYGAIKIMPIIIGLSELYKLTLTYGNYGGGW